MARNERVIVVFVASPSDLEPERNRLEEVIRELNLAWSKTFGIRLDLIRWETHGYPGIGKDPQDVLNQELVDEPDIFIGLLWGKYGTPNKRAGSGTEEEFVHALERYRKDENSVKIMFYFKDAPLNPSSLDPTHLAKIQQFKASLGSEGGLYWKFVTLEEFERLLQLHLARQITKFAEPLFTSKSTKVSPENSANINVQEEELGFLDYLDLAEEHFGELNEIAKRIAEKTRSLGEKFHERAGEISAIRNTSGGQFSRREIRMHVEKVAGDMTQYVATMKAELPILKERLSLGADAAANAVLTGVAMFTGDLKEVRQTVAALGTFRDALGLAYDSIVIFRTTIQEIPRITTDLNRAKRELMDLLQTMLESFDEGRRTMTETVKTLDEYIDQRGQATTT